jgi:hypothetical protein
MLFLEVLVRSAQAQSIVGFWEVKEVKVGDKIMTPVAKWTRINEDGTYQSGNGWLQNAEGTWSLDKETNTFLPVEKNGIKDPSGPFQVNLSVNKMIWEREEEGMVVTVILEPIEKLPKSTADELIGLWDLKDVMKNGESKKASFDPHDKHYIFIRWDRIYVEQTPQGENISGYWYINGHRPEITLLSHSANKIPESWMVSVNDNELLLTGISDSNKGVENIYSRIHEFPE